MSTLIGTKRTTHALHNSTEIAQNDGFMVDADGNFEGKLRDDSTADTFYVLKGVFYPLDLKLAQATGATGVTEVYVFNGKRRG